MEVNGYGRIFSKYIFVCSEEINPYSFERHEDW